MDFLGRDDTILYHFTHNTRFPNLVFTNNFTRGAVSDVGNEVSLLFFFKKERGMYVLRVRFKVVDIFTPSIVEEIFAANNISEILDFVKLQWVPTVCKSYNEFTRFNSSFITIRFNESRYFIGGVDYTDSFLEEGDCTLSEALLKLDTLFNWKHGIGR
jgi:hypothetical protein